MTNNILRLPEVLKVMGISRGTHYRHISMGLFTKPISLGDRAVGWPESEVVSINNARIAGLSSLAIKGIVQELHSSRKNLKVGRLS